MKKILIIGLVGISLAFGNNHAFFADNSCPDLSKKTKDLENLPNLIKRMNSAFPVASEIYTDSLRAYNSVDSVDLFVNSKTLGELSGTPIWGSLMLLKYKMIELSANKNPNAVQFDLEITKKNYDDLIHSINKNNEKWCMVDKYTVSY